MSEDWGDIKSVEIGNDKEDDVKKYIATCMFSDEQDERKVQIINMSGINVRPRPGHKVLVLDLGGGFELGICTDDRIESDLNDGEIEFYSIDSNNEKSAKIKMKPNGEVLIYNANSSILIEDDGDVLVSSKNGSLLVGKDGVTKINNGSEFVALSNKVDQMFDLINNIISTSWVVVPQDGGAALKAAWATAWAGKVSTSATKLKTD